MVSLRVFPRRTSYTPTDGLAFVGDPPLWRVEDVAAINVSVTFSWDVAEGERLAAAWQEQYPQAAVRLGGPALGDNGGAFESGRYVKEGVTFTSRGCVRRCPFCLVPEREGKLAMLSIQPGNVIQDNNFLACPAEHRAAVYAMLRQQPKAAVFAGGIDARLVTAQVAEEFRSIRIDSIFLACDGEAELPHLERAASLLGFLGREKLRCYVLIGYGDDTPERAERRLEACWQAGVMPFAQYYRPAESGARFAYPQPWRALARTWSRPAAMRALHRG